MGRNTESALTNKEQALAILDVRDHMRVCTDELRQELLEFKDASERKHEATERQNHLLRQQIEELQSASRTRELEEELLAKDRQVRSLQQAVDSATVKPKASRAV